MWANLPWMSDPEHCTLLLIFPSTYNPVGSLANIQYFQVTVEYGKPIFQAMANHRSPLTLSLHAHDELLSLSGLNTPPRWFVYMQVTISSE